MKLKKYGEILAYDTAFWMLGVTNPDYPLEQLGKLSLEVSEKFRALAIIVLLVQSDTDHFCHNLIRSAKMREIYLERLLQEKAGDDHHQASGRYDALVDSVAAGDLDLARRIARLSPNSWRKNQEYEDDYCYAQILQGLVQEEPRPQELYPLLKQFAGYLGRESDPRFDLCRALVEREQESFDAAFNALLDDREERIAENKERGQHEDPVVIANRLVFVEGLALLRLAERRGLKTEPEYRHCPSLARVSMATPFPGE